MKFIDVKGIEGGTKTEVTLEMSVAEAELSKKALSEGKLTHLGLPVDAKVQFDVPRQGNAEWAKSEEAKRATPKDGPDPTRRS